ncbi:uncharacterized protein N0V89_001958 [Didymosphaeria variabile]|uniref:Heterokaryon incompatibility domain-containing protein n=1 Tax=Didymosphaeria variabile TaxID=1932322 RepID=A0A9W9CE84_9PLEO|nr:uncharacterized protein N0V89_001958 [Didymosphaeria variabile]KAJ4357383.1 hypothetical protein N0V89_001958 [Didymosphaeria variabile]
MKITWFWVPYTENLLCDYNPVPKQCRNAIFLPCSVHDVLISSQEQYYHRRTLMGGLTTIQQIIHIGTNITPPWLRSAVMLRMEPKDPAASYVSAANSGDEATFQLLDRWVSTCSKEHPERGCLVTNTDNWRPTRLIQLISPLKGKVIATEVANLATQDQYISLSHCWGQHRPTTLLTTNQAEMENGFDVTMLPQTFRDAVQLTWRLGIRYIWIDSLCILQDSAEDWQREAATMGDVYRFAYLNIGATRASDSTQGMFHTRNPGWLEVPRVTIQFEGYEPLSCILGDEWAIYRPIPEGPLMTRGWVLQERLLAPRMVHFGERQISWQCRGGWSNEMHTSATALQNGFHSLYVNEQSDMFEALFEERKNEQDTTKIVARAWSETVRQYAKLRLTFASDKLVALSGLVSRFSRVRPANDQYLAGLWKSELPASLLWYCSKRSKRSETYQAPSWSWASLEADDINTAAMTRGECASLVSANVDVVDKVNPFGQVSGGQVTINALVTKIRVLSQRYAGEHSAYRRYTCLLEEVDLEGYCHDIPDYKTHEGGMKFELGQLYWDDTPLPNAILDVAFIVGSTRNEQVDFGCLLLEKKGEVYERIGYIQFAAEKEKGEVALARKDLFQDVVII